MSSMKQSKASISSVLSHGQTTSATASSGSDDMPRDVNRKRRMINNSSSPSRSKLTASETGQQISIKQKKSSRSLFETQSGRLAENTSRHASVSYSATGLDTPLASHDTFESLRSEHHRASKENQILKKNLCDNEKVIESLLQTLEDIQAMHEVDKNMLIDTKKELSELIITARQNDEIVTTIENSMQCHVCLDLLCKPFALSPCGHVFCQECLQEWFRQSPTSDGEVSDDEEEESCFNRAKTCPSCRTPVRYRPVPIFIARTISSVLAKHRSGSTQADDRRFSTFAVGTEALDPWQGIFPMLSSSNVSDEDSMSSSGDEVDQEVHTDPDEYTHSESTDQSSRESENSEDNDDASSESDTFMLPPSWRHTFRDRIPQAAGIRHQDRLFPEMSPTHLEELSTTRRRQLIRRGATLEMIRNYNISFDLDDGIMARSGSDVFYLGWRIDLAEDDESGRRYMHAIFEDVCSNPAGWMITDNSVNLICRRLVMPD